MLPIPLPQTLLAKGLAFVILVLLIAGASSFATYRYVTEHTVVPLQKEITEYKAKEKAKQESVASDSEDAVKEAAKQAAEKKAAIDQALDEYKKRNGPLGAQRPCSAPRPQKPPVLSGPLLEPPTGEHSPIPELEVLAYQVLSDDGLYTAQKILGQVPPRANPLEDGSLK